MIGGFGGMALRCVGAWGAIRNGQARTGVTARGVRVGDGSGVALGTHKGRPYAPGLQRWNRQNQDLRDLRICRIGGCGVIGLIPLVEAFGPARIGQWRTAQTGMSVPPGEVGAGERQGYRI